MFLDTLNKLRSRGGRIKWPLEPRSTMANFGCGTTWHAAWDNFDFVPCVTEVRAVDLRRPLPFEDCVYDAVYSAHTLEHLPRNQVPSVLAEFRRQHVLPMF